MNKRQKLINRVTRDIINDQVWLYGRKVTSFYKMRKYVKKNNLV